MVIDIDPVIFGIGPLQVRWYGLMYVVGFLVGARIFAHLARRGFLPIREELTDTVVTYLLIGMFIFARLFYVLIYNLDQTHSLLDVVAVWKGGLSFHGAAIGYIVATLLFCRRFKVPFRKIMDGIVLVTPQGLFWGRIGNFMNMELYGRPTDSWIGMVFASDPEGLMRHPSQLYQAMGEGLLLFLIMLFMLKRVKYYGVLSGSFLIGYGLLRYFVEFFREADPQMGYYFGGTTTMGQILCLMMVMAGVWFLLYIRKNPMPVRWFSAEELAQNELKREQEMQKIKDEQNREHEKKRKQRKEKKKRKKK